MPSTKKPKVEIAPVIASSDSDSDSGSDAEPPEVLDSDEDVLDEDVDGATNEESAAEARVKRLKRSRINDRRKARSHGARGWAKSAGVDVGNRSFGNDTLRTCIAASDVKRLVSFVPDSGDSSMRLSTFSSRLALRDEPLSAGPAAVIAANLESFTRKLIGAAVLRSLETPGGPTVLQPALVRQVTRPYEAVLLDHDLSLPNSIVTTAQTTKRVRETVENGATVTTESFLLAPPDGGVDEAPRAKILKKQLKLVKKANEALAARKAAKRERIDDLKKQREEGRARKAAKAEEKAAKAKKSSKSSKSSKKAAKAAAAESDDDDDAVVTI